MTNAALFVTKRRELSLPLLALPFLGSAKARLLLAQYGTWLAFDLFACLVNAVSTLSDYARSGAEIGAWEPYVWELTSWLGFAVASPFLLALDNAVAARRVRPAMRLLAYGPLSVAFSAIHIAVMVGSRPLVYALAGGDYRIGAVVDRFVYEYPKDAVAFVVILGVAFLWRITLDRREAQPAEPSAPTFLVREAGGQRLVRVAEIDWVEAQGNYVALHVGARAHLVRQTMREIEDRLAGFGFIRTHRSALVAVRALRAVARDEAEGLVVKLESGARVPLSQSRRAALLAAMRGRAGQDARGA